MGASFFYKLLAVGVLAAGVAFYFFFREPTIVAEWLGIQNNHILSKYTVYLNSFPSFAHVFSFSILTWLVLERSYENTSILFWVILNAVFEIGQMAPAHYLVWLTDSLQHYFQQGTYSHWDMIAIFIGGVTAKVLMKL